MKHVVLSANWQFSNDPFSAYRCNLVFGANKRASDFLPVQGLQPLTQYKVIGGLISGPVLYEGFDLEAANKAKSDFESEKPDPVKPPFKTPSHKVGRLDTGQLFLPEGKFKLITTQKGTRLVVSGEDTTDDALLFVGCNSGFRGGVLLVSEATTGELIKSCQSGNATGGRIEVIIRLKKAESIAFNTFGRRTNEVYLYTWDGEKVVKKSYSKAEWDLQKELTVESKKSEEQKPPTIKAGDKVTIGGLEVEVVEPTSGLLVVSALAHELVFTDEQKLAPNPELAKKIKAKMAETVVEQGEGFTFVDSVPEADSDSFRILREFSEKCPGVKVISSGISVSAFRKDLPKLVVGPITTPETSRLDNPLKRIFRNKWQA